MPGAYAATRRHGDSDRQPAPPSFRPRSGPLCRAGKQPAAAAIAGLLLGSPAWPQAPGVACDALREDADRLRCYREIVRELEARLAADSAEQQAPNPAAGTAESPPAEREPATPEIAVDPDATTTARPAAAVATAAVTADDDAGRVEIVDIARGPLGNLTVRLANGEVWRQLDSDNTQVVLPDAATTRYAIIEEGFLGSRRMKIVGTARSFRVRRME